MLDNIIDRKDDAIDDTSNDTVDTVEDSSHGSVLNSMTKTLDDILLASNNNNSDRPVVIPRRQRSSQEATHKVTTLEPKREILQNNQTLFTTTNMPIKVLEPIPAFEKVPTYTATFMSSTYILKWYDKSFCSDLHSFRNHLEALNRDKDYPACVLRPKIFTKSNADGSFGCLFDYVEDFYSLRNVIEGHTVEYDVNHVPKQKNVRFKSIDAMVTAGINIAKACNKLNNSQDYFYSFSDENLLINITNGDILLDIANYVGKDESPLQVDTECIYLPKELLNNSMKPNENSNNYILSVILFRLFFHDHPLEGRNVINDVCLELKDAIKYYRENAVFIFNPNDSSNRPVRGVHYTVISMWEKYPQYLKGAFTNAFCSKLFSIDDRYTPEYWLNVLMQLKSDILHCVCGRNDFAFLYEFTEEGFYQCQRCGSKYHSLYFKKRQFNIPICDGNNIYASFFKDKVTSYDEIMGTVIENKLHANLYGLKNLSNIEWICSLSNGDLKNIKPSDVMPVFAGNTIDYYGSMAEFDYVDRK
jgi:hypothetical protein